MLGPRARDCALIPLLSMLSLLGMLQQQARVRQGALLESSVIQGRFGPVRAAGAATA